MQAWSRALGVDCVHCHDRGDGASTAKPAHAAVPIMAGLFEELPTYVTKEGMPLFQCYLCHQGSVKPER